MQLVRSLLQVQGAVIVVSVLHMVIGASGAVGFLTRIVSPLVLASMIALVGLGLFGTASRLAATNWAVSIPCVLVRLQGTGTSDANKLLIK